MITAPDGSEVVATAADAHGLSPLLVVDAVVGYLDDCHIGSGPLSWARIGDGQANVTYRLRRQGADVVLRRGPRPPFAPSTHDMVREARILRVAGAHGVPVPEVLAVCEDESILGVPFYLMRWLDGDVLTDSTPEGMRSAPQAVGAELVRGLAAVHSIDIDDPEVAALGRPDGYLERQLHRFAALWDANTSRTLPLAEVLWRWLVDNRPQTQRNVMVHGDYRLGNVMFYPSGPARLLAILDWEMSTLGDPLADLGYMAVTYSEPGEERLPVQMTTMTCSPGHLSRSDLIAEYAKYVDLDLEMLPWYQTFALWKAAVYCEAIYARWLRGERPEDTVFAPSLEAGVPDLLRAADRQRRG